jgi:hypothetical protein
MKMITRQHIVLMTIGILLVGSGCVAPEVSSLSPEQASQSLVFSVGNEIVVRPTVLGVGGVVVDWLGGEQEERVIFIDEWKVGESVDLSWSISMEVETSESITAREAYQEAYASSPVGVEIPDEPKPVYKEETVEGSIVSTSLADATTLMLPDAWPEGDADSTETSLIWLSRSNYDELVSTRKTSVSLGLFDESLMKAEEATGQLKSLVDRVGDLLAPFTGQQNQPDAVKEVDTRSLTVLEADSDWGEYILLINGVRTTVQTIEARNAFASYKILANPENPLILEIQLTPLSKGNLELLSRDGLAQGFGGYEVTDIITK